MNVDECASLGDEMRRTVVNTLSKISIVAAGVVVMGLWISSESYPAAVVAGLGFAYLYWREVKHERRERHENRQV